jgi:hypothetical protein
VKVDEKSQAALRQSDTQGVALVMTPEFKEKTKRLADQIIDLLKAGTEGPIEAYMVLQFIVRGFEDSYDIRGSVIVENEDGTHS